MFNNRGPDTEMVMQSRSVRRQRWILLQTELVQQGVGVLGQILIFSVVFLIYILDFFSSFMLFPLKHVRKPEEGMKYYTRIILITFINLFILNTFM